MQTQSSADRITTSLSLAHQRKNKQTSKVSAQISPYEKLTQTTEPILEGRSQKEERIQPWSLEKGDLRHSKLKKKMKRQRNTTQMKKQTRNSEVWRNEEEIGKVPEKELRVIVEIIKNRENKMEKM